MKKPFYSVTGPPQNPTLQFKSYKMGRTSGDLNSHGDPLCMMCDLSSHNAGRSVFVVLLETALVWVVGDECLQLATKCKHDNVRRNLFVEENLFVC